MKEDKKISIYEALCKFQGALTTIDKKKKGYNFKYADLSDIWDAIRKPLTDNGFSIVQLVQSEEGKNYIVTKLFHISGECIESKTLIEFTAKKHQDVGSSITYYRRYALSAMLGIVSDEDVDDKLDKQEEVYQESYKKISQEQLMVIENLINGHNDIRQRMLKRFNSLQNIDKKDFESVVNSIHKLINDKKNNGGQKWEYYI